MEIVMLFLILINLIIFNNDPFQIDQVDYYYFTDNMCIPCQKQLPIILKLQDEGFNFEIIDDQKSIDNFKIYAFPTIIIEIIDFKLQEVREIRLIGFQSYDKLKRILLKNKVANRG